MISLPAYLRAAISAATLVVSTTAVFASEDLSSSYTSLDLEECRFLGEDEFGITFEFACEGLQGWTVVVRIVDGRTFLRLRRNGEELGSEPPTGLPFNKTGDTLEWRVRDFDGELQPYALIARWFVTTPEGPDTQRMYVFRFDPEARVFCTAGHVEVAGNSDHNEDARALADRIRDTTSCQRTQSDR